MSPQKVFVLSLILTISFANGDPPTSGLYDESHDQTVTSSDGGRGTYIISDGYLYPEMEAFLKAVGQDDGQVQRRSARFDNSFILKRELDNLLKHIEIGLASSYESDEQATGADEAVEQVGDLGRQNMKRFRVPSIIKRYNVPSIIKRYHVPSILKRMNVPSIIKKKLMIPAVIKRQFAYNPSIFKRYDITSGDNEKKSQGQVENVKEDTEEYYAIQ